MTKQHRWLMIGLVVGTALSAAAIGSFTLVDETSSVNSESTDNVRIVDDRKPPEQWVINAAYGRGALSNLRAAYVEVTNDNAQAARKGVAVAQSLLTKIKLEPSTDEATPETDFVLVHSEIRVLGEVDPPDSLQATLDSIRLEFEVTDHDAIVTALGSLNVPLAYTRINLPLTDTIALVDDILRALDSEHSEQARSKLLEIGSRLRIETVQIGMEDTSDSSPEAVDAG